MVTRNFALRAVGAGMMLATAAAASAFSIDLISSGTFVNTPPIYTTAETVILQTSTVSTPALTQFHFTGDEVLLTGSAGYTNGVDSFQFDLTIAGFVLGPNTSSTSGNWTYTGGTGAFANLQGSGTWSASYDANTKVSSYTTVVGELTPVPEPASLACLGLGVAFVLRRRR